MIERPAAGERAVIVQVDFGQPEIEDQLEEVRLLSESAGATVVAEVRGRRHSPDANVSARDYWHKFARYLALSDGQKSPLLSIAKRGIRRVEFDGDFSADRVA